MAIWRNIFEKYISQLVFNLTLRLHTVCFLPGHYEIFLSPTTIQMIPLREQGLPNPELVSMNPAEEVQPHSVDSSKG